MATNPSEVGSGEGVSIDQAMAAMEEAGGDLFDEESEGQLRDEQGRFASDEGEPDPDGSEEELEASDEDQEEVDAEDEDEDYDDEDDPLVTVKIDGEEQEIKLSELRNGYQRQADYTRKTQELAEQRNQVNTQMQNLGQQAVAYAQSYIEIAESIAQFAPTEQEITDAWGYDPQEAAALQDKRKRVLMQADQAKQLAVVKYREAQRQHQQNMAQAGQELKTVVPEWSDDDRRQKEIPAVAKYLVSQGMDPSVVETTADATAWKIARKAWLYDQSQESAANKQVKPKAERIRKGNSHRPRLGGKRKAVAQAHQRAIETGSRQSAVDFLTQLEE